MWFHPTIKNKLYTDETTIDIFYIKYFIYRHISAFICPVNSLRIEYLILPRMRQGNLLMYLGKKYTTPLFDFPTRGEKFLALSKNSVMLPGILSPSGGRCRLRQRGYNEPPQSPGIILFNLFNGRTSSQYIKQPL